ncbi:hypothetical protein BDV98DRAFT_557902 [Pterulicium gracile]|uniref:Uncharacterized protein n=1 Tax=Pterulicium gracile TaxID=1884261 RepID=A0A5C3R3B2_9AGAR|nr:hypothetical protein BDV98DRAFT_557902 [Pterula gracilis]
MAEQSTTTREVNDILHRLRGEQFRHHQNLKASRSHLTSHHAHRASLPVNVEDIARNGGPTAARVRSTAAGPAPPRSWLATSQEPQNRRSADWRSQALYLPFIHSPFLSQTQATHVAIVTPDQPIPSPVTGLTLLCLRRILQLWAGSDQLSELVSYVPVHLRVLAMRDAAVFAPLSRKVLQALGSPDGELVVVGSGSKGTAVDSGVSIKRLLTATSHSAQRSIEMPSSSASHSPTSPSVQDYAWDYAWDSPLHDLAMPLPLRTLTLLSTRLSAEDLLALPSTITHLSLIDIELVEGFPIQLHRLPALCPLVLFLDLSYNTWLAESSPALNKVPWSKWRRLEILGSRGCSVGAETVKRINEGRWDDVRIIVD